MTPTGCMKPCKAGGSQQDPRPCGVSGDTRSVRLAVRTLVGFVRGDPAEQGGPLTPLWCSGSTPFCQDGSAGSIPARGAGSARYANRQSGQAQTLGGVGSTPTRVTENASDGAGTPGGL